MGNFWIITIFTSYFSIHDNIDMPGDSWETAFEKDDSTEATDQINDFGLFVVTVEIFFHL